MILLLSGSGPPRQSLSLLSYSQVYILAIVAQLQRGAEPYANQDLIILVPAYDPANIFQLSYDPNPLAELDMEPDRCDVLGGCCHGIHPAEVCVLMITTAELSCPAFLDIGGLHA